MKGWAVSEAGVGGGEREEDELQKAQVGRTLRKIMEMQKKYSERGRLRARGGLKWLGG